MYQIKLEWHGPFRVSELRNKLLEESIKSLFENPTYACFSHPGLYVFLDENLVRVLYVGQATASGVAPLRKRLREHLKGQTKFSFRVKKNNLDLDRLQLIVAPIKKNEDLEIISMIERAITFEMNPPGNFDEAIEIVNTSNSRPLPERIQAGFLQSVPQS